MAEKEEATIKKGKEALQWILSLYEQDELPVGLLPFQELIEVGFMERTGSWIHQEKRIEHTFKKIGRLVSYDAEMSGYPERKMIRKLKGAKAKNLMVWTPGRSGSKPSMAWPASTLLRPLPPANDRHCSVRLDTVIAIVFIFI
ncbi:hypothetical protein BT93_F2651 [Corymbia citriodora subsp. variegata]|nr:hypothetical protein BT93_F2651 [Corymbia citriodora subsp. variegata]